jgi:hypothetical protein
MTVFKCPNCGEVVHNHVRNCVVCGADVGCPNVRAANDPEEISALENRAKTAEQDAGIRGASANLKDFCQAVADNSKAVICRPLGKINELVSSDNELYSTFYEQVSSEARLPENNIWDKSRGVADQQLFPHYPEHIRFASLSLDGKGATGYGGYCLVLKDAMIKDRATVFEANSTQFVQQQRLVAGDPFPAGYRATWSNRAMLAAAKLGGLITSATTSDEYPGILLGSGATDGDFIEVHIYGPIHRRAIQSLSGENPRNNADKVLLKSVRKKLTEIGASLEVS